MSTVMMMMMMGGGFWLLLWITISCSVWLMSALCKHTSKRPPGGVCVLEPDRQALAFVRSACSTRSQMASLRGERAGDGQLVGTAVKYSDFPVEALWGNQLSGRQLCSSCGTPRRQLRATQVPVPSSSGLHTTLLRKHRITPKRGVLQTVAWQVWPLDSTVSLLLCSFLWNLCSGPLRGLDEQRQKENINSILRSDALSIHSASKYWLSPSSQLWALCGSGCIISLWLPSILSTGPFYPLGHPWEEHQGIAFPGRSLLDNGDMFETFFSRVHFERIIMKTNSKMLKEAIWVQNSRTEGKRERVASRMDCEPSFLLPYHRLGLAFCCCKGPLISGAMMTVLLASPWFQVGVDPIEWEW